MKENPKNRILTSGINTTRLIVPISGRVAGTVTLTSGLNPDDLVDVGGAGLAGGARTEAGTLHVAPVTPDGTDALDTGTALVDNELGGEAGGGEDGRESLVKGRCQKRTSRERRRRERTSM